MSKKIGLICGRVSKAAALYEQLAKRGFEVTAADIRDNKLKSKINALKCMKACDVVFAVAEEKHFPLLCRGKKYFKCKVFNFIDGNTEIDAVTPKYLKQFDANIAEFSYIKEMLEAVGVTNCDVQPPFKEVNGRNAVLQLSDEGKSRLCILCDDKGAVAQYNRCHDDKITISTEINADSLAVVLPNICDPQTIIEAYSKGLPVIAWDMGGNDEIIRNFETGWFYPNEKAGDLYESIEYAMAHKDEMIAMRPNSALLTARYTPNYVIPRIIDKYLK